MSGIKTTYQAEKNVKGASAGGEYYKSTYAGLLFVWVMSLLIFPQLPLLTVALNLLIMVLISSMQFYSALLPVKKLISKKNEQEPFVSIHIPVHNEPPELVLKTLEAIQQLNYKNYEVIVLDNNTENPEVWKPVEKKCGEAGASFKFKHVEGLKGFKAGALNLCNKMSHQATEFVLVIDADYRVHPQLLQEALSNFSEENIALVQFPQAYLNTDTGNRGMQAEYNHFFAVYMNMANHFNCVLSTGTVSVIRMRALEATGGWSGNSITEDCELGLRFHQEGFRGVYVAQPLGKGLMPVDLHDLKTQRERWVFGNMQTLNSFFYGAKKRLSIRQCAGIVTQLTAWFNFLFIPVIGALSGAIGMAVSAMPVYNKLMVLSLVSIWFYLTGKFIFFRLSFRNSGKSFRKSFDAYLVHLGMAWEGAVSWLRCLCGENILFKRTNKFLGLKKKENVLTNLSLSLILIIAGALAFASGYYLEWTFAWLASPAFAAVFFLRRLTVKTFKLTQKL